MLDFLKSLTSIYRDPILCVLVEQTNHEVILGVLLQTEMVIVKERWLHQYSSTQVLMGILSYPLPL